MIWCNTTKAPLKSHAKLMDVFTLLWENAQAKTSLETVKSIALESLRKKNGREKLDFVPVKNQKDSPYDRYSTTHAQNAWWSNSCQHENPKVVSVVPVRAPFYQNVHEVRFPRHQKLVDFVTINRTG